MKKLIRDINNELFEFEIADGGGVSVLEAGYVITPDGEFIPVKDNEYHKDVFSRYLNKYLDNKTIINYDSKSVMLGLLEVNHIIYYGIKPQVITNIYENKGGNTNGFGTF